MKYPWFAERQVHLHTVCMIVRHFDESVSGGAIDSSLYTSRRREVFTLYAAVLNVIQLYTGMLVNT